QGANARAGLDATADSGGAGDAVVTWLELPPDIDEAVFELARQLTADDATPYERARRLRSFFLQNFEYTLDQPTAGADDPLSTFVLDVKAGHCEHFATAFATMLRAAGVPSRVVGGFQGGIWDDSSNTVVFGLNNAHAWVEWYQPGVGWVTDDATPAFVGDTLSPLAMWMERVRRAWDDYVVDYGLMEQAAIAGNVGRQIRRFTSNHPRLSRNWLQPLAIALAGLAWVLIGIHFWRRRQARISEDGLAQAIQRALEDETQSSLPAQQTFQETLDTIPDLPPWRAELLRHAIAHYHSRRFGDARLDVNRELELVQGLNQLHRGGPAIAGYGAD
ncbi:MAG: transglutaminase domain-containing protein, partial [Myxococcota bacterium]